MKTSILLRRKTLKKNILKRLGFKNITTLLLLLFLSFALVSCSSDVVENIESQSINEDNTETDSTETISRETKSEEAANEIEEDGYYTSKEDVSLYIYIYGRLPDNFVTKNKARELGWESNQGNLWDVTDNNSIGGDRFGNREGLLPDKEGRQYYECDINYEGGYRGAERLVYSNDSLIYYTADHYESFELLYGDE